MPCQHGCGRNIDQQAEYCLLVYAESYYRTISYQLQLPTSSGIGERLLLNEQSSVKDGRENWPTFCDESYRMMRARASDSEEKLSE